VGQDLAVEVFNKYCENGKMGAEALLRFLHEEQGESKATLEDAKHLLEANRKENSKIPKLHSLDMKLEDFISFVVNPKLNGALNTQVHHDMTQPVSHYWIFTGHNSYLTGNQLSSDSSDVPIINALRRGVRVIELDLWPDDKGNIKVTHGNTLTDPVSFEKCLIAIKANAFVASQYPVCITLEDHLTCALQSIAAEMLLRILGQALYYPPTGEAPKEFPSPESLKGRIIVSTKPAKEYLESTAVDKKDDQRNAELMTEIRKEGQENEPLSDTASKLNINKENAAPEVDKAGEDSDSDDDDSKKNPEYSRLITIRQVKPMKGTSLKDRLVIEDTVKRISLAESKLEDVADQFPEILVQFTQRNILRVYPDGTRINSSNYNPVLAWNHGAQMVAQNMQGYGKELWLSHGKFRANGGCGYVLKPKFLRENLPTGQIFNPSAKKNVEMVLRVKVMTSPGWKETFSKRHFDLFSAPDFFTRLLIAGVRDDIAKAKTQPVKDTWNPHWNEEFDFSLRVPELALLRVEVREDDGGTKDGFAGQTCLPISEIKDGYRCETLFDKTGAEIPGVKILFHFQKLLLHKSTCPNTLLTDSHPHHAVHPSEASTNL
jgi:phosphatidylinositol phospholipase C delta